MIIFLFSACTQSIHADCLRSSPLSVSPREVLRVQRSIPIRSKSLFITTLVIGVGLIIVGGVLKLNLCITLGISVVVIFGVTYLLLLKLLNKVTEIRARFIANKSPEPPERFRDLEKQIHNIVGAEIDCSAMAVEFPQVILDSRFNRNQ